MAGDARAPGRSHAIDVLRALSILWVVGFWHVLDYMPGYHGYKNPVFGFVTVALLGLFTMLSGYLMGGKDVRLDAGALREFYGRRFARIYPPLAAACLVYYVGGLSPSVPLAKTALLISMLWGPPAYTLWFMAMIVLLYAVTPLLLALRNRTVTYVATIVAATALLVVAETMGAANDPRLALYLPAYGAGVWLVGRLNDWRRIMAYSLMAAAIGLLLAFLSPLSEVERGASSILWALAAPLVLLALAMTLEPHLSPSRPTRIVAQASYFLYLFHRPVYVIVLKLIDPGTFEARFAILVLVALPLSLALAWVGQRGYDEAWTAISHKLGMAGTGKSRGAFR